jgi:hypothetical protein
MRALSVAHPEGHDNIRAFLLERVAVRQGLHALRTELPNILVKCSDVLLPRMLHLIEHLHGRRLRPGDAFLPDRKQSLAQVLKADPAPSWQPNPAVCDLSRR